MRLDYPNVEGNIDIYMKVLRAICGDTHDKSMADLGCCFAPNTPKLGFERRYYVDVVDRKLDHPEEQEFFIQHDAVDWVQALSMMTGLKLDVVICSDFLEHLHPDRAKSLLFSMCEMSYKQIIFVPMGEIFKLHNTSEDDPEAHHSIWHPDDFKYSDELHGDWATIVFPDYHKQWNHGAFFAFRSRDMNWQSSTHKDFERVKNLIQL